MLKLTVEKAGDHLLVEVLTDTTKGPLILDLTQAQLDGLVVALTTLRQTNSAKFSLEM